MITAEDGPVEHAARGLARTFVVCPISIAREMAAGKCERGTSRPSPSSHAMRDATGVFRSTFPAQEVGRKLSLLVYALYGPLNAY